MSLVSDSKGARKTAALPSVKKKVFSRSEAKRLGNELNVDWRKVSLKEFRDGINVEREHAKSLDSLQELGQTALDHLKERPDYYTRLKKYVEKEGSMVKKARNSGPEESWKSQLARIKTSLEARKSSFRKSADGEEEVTDQKISKAEADYRLKSPYDDQRCETCEYTQYKENGGCEKVKGKIRPEAWCKLFEAEEAA